MSFPRAQKKIARMMLNLFKREFRDEIVIPSDLAHERIREAMLSGGVSDPRLRRALEKGDVIEAAIRNLKREKGDEYQVALWELRDRVYYMNMKHRLYPVFRDLPAFVRSRDHLDMTLPTAITAEDHEELREEYGADPLTIVGNIRDRYRNKKWTKRVTADVVEDMVRTWNECCDSTSPPFGRSMSGKYYVNPNSPYTF